MSTTTASCSDRMIEVRGTQLRLLEGGAGDPVLLLHPAGGAGMWLPQHECLARDFRVIAPDHPGFAGSPVDEKIDRVEDLAYLYSALLDQLGIEQATVIGSSFGGWIAAELAVLDPHRVRKLVLINPIGLRIPDAPVRDQFAMQPHEKVAALFFDPSIAAGLFPSEPTIDDIVEMYRNDSAFARYAWQPFCSNPKLAGRLYRITAPTLVLASDHDGLVPRAHAGLYASSIANAQLEMVEQAGHAVLLEKPEETVRTIAAFVND